MGKTAKLLAHGITTVRDAGGITVGLKQAIDEGLVDGPRIYPSNAYISQTCGHGDNDERKRNRDIQYRIPSSGVLADGVPEVLRAVREQFYRGASQIKIMAGGGMSSEHDPGANDVKAKTAYATELINKYDLKILFGTDMMVTYPDYEPRQGLDFKEYKKRFGSYKGIVSATGNVNDLIKLTTYQNPYPEGEIGVLKKGSFADILVIQGNPVEDLELLYDVNNIQLIMKDGKVYKNTLS